MSNEICRLLSTLDEAARKATAFDKIREMVNAGCNTEAIGDGARQLVWKYENETAEKGNE